jgi:hypothetical protein
MEGPSTPVEAMAQAIANFSAAAWYRLADVLRVPDAD